MKYSPVVIVSALVFAGNLLWAQRGVVTLEGRWPDGPCYSSFVAGSHAFVGNGSALDVVDISNTAAPKRIGRVVLPSVIMDLVVSGNYAYVANYRSGLRIVDVSVADSPTEVASMATGGEALSIVVAGTRAYIAADTAGVKIIDITIPTQPEPICSLTFNGYASDIAVWGNTLAVARPDSGLMLFDVSDSRNPIEITRYGLPGGYHAVSVELSAGHAYVASIPSQNGYGKLHILDIHDLPHPFERASFFLPGDWGSSGRNVSRGDSLLFVTYNSDVGPGLFVAAFDTLTAPRTLGHLYTKDARSSCASGSLLYLADGSGGLKILDISSSAAPFTAGTYPTSDRTNDVVVVNQRAYLACWEDGIRILDLTVSPPSDFGSYNWSNSIWGSAVDVQGSYAYVTSNISDVEVIDISNPDSSIRAGGLGPAVGTAIRARDTLLFVADRDNGLRIASISDPRQPVWLAHVALGDKASNLALTGSYVYLAAGTSGTRIIDVANPYVPQMIATLPTPRSSADVAVEGGFAYVVGGGLQIYDVSDPHSPILISSTDISGYPSKVSVSNSFAYVLSYEGVHVFDVSNRSAPQMVDFIPTGAYGRNVFAAGDRFYVADGDCGLYMFRNTLITSTGFQESTPGVISLEQNYPNPFNPSTAIRYGLPFRSHVTLSLFNTLGQQVAVLQNGEQEAGVHEVRFDANGLPSGVYFYRLHAGIHVITKRLLVIR